MAKLHIRQSVGVGGSNQPNDVKAVQTALNQLLSFIKPTKQLTDDGRLGADPAQSETVAAIKRFQSQILMLKHPDGRIDVNGRTHRKINERLTFANAPATPLFNTTIPYMRTARAEIGQREVPGAAANPRILSYFQASGYWGTDDSGGANAWCGSFVAWVMKQNFHTPVAKGFRAKEWAKFGKPIANPVHGAIGIKSRTGGGHVAFVVGKSANGQYLYMLGGNQSNSVNIARYPLSVWDTFVVPHDFDESTASLPIYTSAASHAGSEA